MYVSFTPDSLANIFTFTPTFEAENPDALDRIIDLFKPVNYGIGMVPLKSQETFIWLSYALAEFPLDRIEMLTGQSKAFTDSNCHRHTTVYGPHDGALLNGTTAHGKNILFLCKRIFREPDDFTVDPKHLANNDLRRIVVMECVSDTKSIRIFSEGRGFPEDRIAGETDNHAFHYSQAVKVLGTISQRVTLLPPRPKFGNASVIKPPPDVSP